MAKYVAAQACAAVYGALPSHELVKLVEGQLRDVFGGDEAALLNHYYYLVYEDPGTFSTGDVATIMARNLGYTGSDLTSQAQEIAAKLGAVPPMQRGAEAKRILDEYEELQADTPEITSFIQKTTALETAVADPLYLGIPDRNINFGSLSVEQINHQTDEKITATALSYGEKEWSAVAGRNVFTALTSALTSERTLDPKATITGGSSIDTLRVSLSADHTPSDTFRLLKVEQLQLTNTTVAQRNFDAKGATDISSISLQAETGAIGVSNLPAAGISVTVRQQKQGNLNLSFSEASKVSSSQTDSLSLALINTGATTPLQLNVPGIDELVIRSLGESQNKLALGTGASDIKALTVKGDTAFALTSSINTAGSLNTVTATELSADLSFVNQTNGLRRVLGPSDHPLNFQTTQTDASLEYMAGGLANDSFSALTSSVNSIPTIDGGEGENAFTITGGPSKSITPTMSDVQTLVLGDIAGSFNLDAKNVTGLQNVKVTTASAVLKLYNLQPDAVTLTLQGASTPQAGGIDMDTAGSLKLVVSKGESTATVTNSLKVMAPQASLLDLEVQTGILYAGEVTVPKATELRMETSEGATSGLANGATLNAALAESLVIANKADSAMLKVNAPKLQTLQVSHTGKQDMTLRFDPPAEDPILQTLTIKDVAGSVTLAATDASSKLFQKVTQLTLETQAGKIVLPPLPGLSQPILEGSGLSSELRFSLAGNSASPEMVVQVKGFAGGGVFADDTKASGPNLESKGGIVLDLTASRGSKGQTDTLTSNLSTNKTVLFGRINGGDGPVSVLANGAGVVGVGAIQSKSMVTVDLRNADNGSLAGVGVAAGQPSVVASEVQLSAQNATALGSVASPFIVQSETTGEKTEFAFSFQGSAEQDVVVMRGAAHSNTLKVVGDLGQAPSAQVPDFFFVEPDPAATSLLMTLDASGLRGAPDGLSLVVLRGTVKNDQIVGSQTNDLIIFGGAGNDTVTGGQGNDIFLSNLTNAYTKVSTVAGSNKFSLADVKLITDFNLGRDMVAFAKASTGADALDPVVFTQQAVATQDYSQTASPALPADGFYKFIRGTLVGSDFITSAGGVDVLYAVGHSGASKAVVLKGYGGASSTTFNQTFSGTSADFVLQVDTTGSLNNNFQFTGLIGVA